MKLIIKSKYIISKQKRVLTASALSVVSFGEFELTTYLEAGCSSTELPRAKMVPGSWI